MKDTQPPKRAKRTRLWIALAVLALIVIVTVLACTLSLLLNNSSSSGTNSSGHSDSEKPYWPGWSGIKHLTVFGDSMTNVDFNIDGEQPSRANPIGNPEFPGRTSSIGPNWAGFLTGTYNASFIRTIDLGSGGATVDSDILDGDFPTTRSFADQVLSDWIPNYVKTKPSQFNWAANDTLFAIFFGLNDVRGAYFDDWISKGKSLNEDVARYVALLGDLYRSGSRNFLVLKLPPFQRAPMVANNTEGQREVKSLIDGYNTNLTQALSEFSNTNSDAAVFLFDTHKLWNQIFDDPCSYKETCPLKDTTTYCPAYENERENPYLDDPECDYPLDKYFWINRIHCIYRVHQAMADGIASYLTEMS